MAGGKSTPKKDKKIKVAGGESVKIGKILVRGVDEYKAGKQASLQFLIGQAMKATKGSANPEMLKTIFLAQLSK